MRLLPRLLIFSLLAFVSSAATPPLAFEANHGQTAPEVRYLARAPGQRIFLTGAGAVLALRGQAAPVELRFPGAHISPRLAGTDPLPGRSNYFRGADPERWRTGLRHFARVRAGAVYPGIDVEYYGNRGRLEYDLVVAPGADPALIRIRFGGVRDLELSPSGDLLLHTAAATLRQHRPVAWQMDGGHRVPVNAQYRLAPSGEVRIELASYDRSRELVIDPVVSFSTFLGGTGLEEGRAVAVDAQGNVVVAGITESVDFPTTTGAFERDYQSGVFQGDAYVAKFSPDGATLLFSTFLGGARRDIARAITLDEQGNIYVAGDTESNDFPTTAGALQVFNASRGVLVDGFVTKLNQNGSSLVYSTYLGDSETDQIHGIAVAAGSVVVAGSSDSGDFPTTAGAFQTTCPGLGFGGFVSRLATDGKSLVYSTRLCGSSNDEVLAVALDGAGIAAVGGATSSPDFPTTTGALRTSAAGSGDGFVARVAADGGSLVFSTYLGGTAEEEVRGVGVDSQGNVIAAGFTRSADFPATAGSLQPQHADGGAFADAFVSKLNAAGGALVYSTFLGGGAIDQATALAVDANGAAHVTGFTESADFPTTSASCQTGYGGRRDAFAARLRPDGSALNYSLFLSGRYDEIGLAVAAGPGRGTYVTGQTGSPNFTTTLGAYRPAYFSGYRGATDAFIARVDDSAAPPAPCVAHNALVNGASFLPGPVAPGEIVSFFGFGLGPGSAILGQPDEAGFFPKELAGTRVLFDGVPAPMILSFSGQLNAIVPYAVAGKEMTTVVIEYLGDQTAPLTVGVTEASPAMFSQSSSGRGAAAVLNQDFSTNTPQNPARRGDIIQIFATGEGQTTPGGVDGKVASGVLPKPLLAVKVRVGGVEAPVHYVGAAPGFVAGVIQINVQVPGSITPGNAVPIEIRIGDHPSPPELTVAVQ